MKGVQKVKRLFFCIAVGSVVLAGTAVSAMAQTIEADQLSVKNYRDLQVMVVVKDNENSLSNMGITEDVIRNKVELRLRLALPLTRKADGTKVIRHPPGHSCRGEQTLHT
jgi:hypothetical protein